MARGFICDLDYKLTRNPPSRPRLPNHANGHLGQRPHPDKHLT